MLSYKRKAAIFLAACLFVISLFTFACNDGGAYVKTDETVSLFTVKYIDVGDGDATLIKFPDGTVTLIDCGEDAFALSSVEEALSDFRADKIDNFIITHLHSSSAGNAEAIIAEYAVGRVFLPFIKSGRKNDLYDKIVSGLKPDTEIEVSERGKIIESKNAECYAVFLSPLPYGETDSPYNDFNLEDFPSDDMIDACSAVVLFVCGDVRFLFTGDAGADIEEKLINDYYSETADEEFITKKADLSCVDYFKVPRRGGNGACSSEFLETIKPRNAIISVSGLNNNGCPSSAVLKRIEESGEVRVFRTDVYGDVQITVNVNGGIKETFEKTENGGSYDKP